MLENRAVRRVRRQEPVLDQGVAIAGELRVKLFGLNLLPIQVRLLISSKDLATEVGLDWWRDEKTRAAVRGGGGGRAPNSDRANRQSGGAGQRNGKRSRD
jgi:hypothetical protein